MSPELLGLAWRKGRSDELRRRRAIVAASLAACGAMGVVSTYQSGIVPRLPELPTKHLNSSAVSGSRRAYATLQTPDAILGLVSFATTAAAASIGSPGRATHQPWLSLGMGGKLLFDVFQGLRLVRAQWLDRTFCSWCLTASALSLLSAAMAVPEVASAIRTVLRRGAGQPRIQ